MITNPESGTRIDEVTAGIYRISTPLDVIPGGFTFNSYLVIDDNRSCFTPDTGSSSLSRWKRSKP